MMTACKLRLWMLLLSLSLFSSTAGARIEHAAAPLLSATLLSAPPATAASGLLRQAGPMLAGTSRGQMRVGLTIVAPADEPAADEEGFAGLDAEVRCESSDLGYRECRTPFRGAVKLSHELSEVICVEGGNWGWRAGAVWVDRGCSAVFVKIPTEVAAVRQSAS
ncbi:DUF3011 domain-containing protein [Lysobacter sp. D1-1-M9]|uniref:DUF3011 domain-containing protein n=1 Tax=Novilysobacter longmucuonensis TaxID=3098603 RepID=UPI002FCA21DE